jgi:deoxyribodipyrimidine photo-lyase
MLSSRSSQLRIQTVGTAPVNEQGQFVLYWMIAARRAGWNFALDRAIEWARKLNRPLVVFEPLRVAYPWASDRLHRFVLEGMRENAARFAKSPVFYYPYVEPRPDADKGLLAGLASRACLVVTDDYPCFFLPRMVLSAAAKLPVRLETVDSNGLLPWRATDQVFTTAYAFRRYLQKRLPEFLVNSPHARPLARLELPRLARLPSEIHKRWPAATAQLLAADSASLARLPIDHRVGPASFSGGTKQAEATMHRFLRDRLDGYLEDRNEPDLDVTSGLSPYLHFGHLAAHEVFHALMQRERWSPDRLAEKATGKRTGWWGVGPAAEAFLDQLVTWRELGFNMAALRSDYDQYESLPAWAQKTLREHARDKRPRRYSKAQLEGAATYDRLWNAAQRQLSMEGRLHNYLRMLWGKKILEWSRSPREALSVMIDLNNKYAVDGRDPNSYSGIFWVLGRYDRPWGPERPIYGKIRYMSSENTARKLDVRQYIEKYATETNGRRKT